MAEQKAIECGDLRVVFHWRGDRYGHTIERRIEGEWRPLLESVEGAPDDDWPPSPPLQNLHIESRPGGQVALLVGMAGKSHWSASVTPLTGRDGLLFDVACRTHWPPQRLAATYRTQDNVAVKLLAFIAEPDVSELIVGEAGHERTWCFVPTDRAKTFPATVRWRYRIELAE